MPERRHGRPDDELRADREHDARAWRAHHHQGSVLLVDCLPDEQAMYELVLRRSGFDPIVTCDAQAAFEQAVSRQPSVIVVDVTIPDGGLALTERLRADARTRAVIIIVISGHAFPSDRVAAVRAGCDAFLPKPCVPDALITAIETLLDRQARGPQCA